VYITILTSHCWNHVPYTKNTTFGKFLEVEPEIPIHHEIDAHVVDLTDCAPVFRNDTVADAIALFYKNILRPLILGPCCDPTLSAAAMSLYGTFIGKKTVILATQDKNNYFYEMYHRLFDASSAYFHPEILEGRVEHNAIFCNPDQVRDKTEGLHRGAYNMVTIDYRIGSADQCAVAKNAYLTKGFQIKQVKRKPPSLLSVKPAITKKPKVETKRQKKEQQVISSEACKGYPKLFEMDLHEAYQLTRHMSSIEDKIQVWKSMPLVALDINKRNSKCSNRKTWILVCLLMANTELKHWFSDEELARLPTEHVLKDMRSLYRYKNLSTTQSWRAWSGYTHLTRIPNGYKLSWTNY